ncbi:hypothetical protein vseg_005052 [Gypsophila vaccaria]
MASMFSTYGYVVLFLMSCWRWQSCDGEATFGFNIHHRFSEPVKAMLDMNNEVPEVGTMEYYNSMVHRDHFHGRRLAGLTFAEGNATFHVPELGYLYYANVSVGTPESWFLVALDTGSGLFWLPCDCGSHCVRSFELTPTETIDFNIYSLSTSTSGKQLPCSSPFCTSRCIPSQNQCPYRIEYLSANTSTTGYLVEDLLHLTTDTGPSKLTNVRIPFGCGVTQTGHFLEAGAPNGLFGIAMDAISLPSILARQKNIPNSFSMCFSLDGIGRITFGDKGSHNQGQTPVIPNIYDLYTVNMTGITVGPDVSAASLEVIFDTGTSFTLLTDPVYSLISEKFNTQVEDRRVRVHPDNAFQYCYGTTSSPDDLVVPAINLTFGGESHFSVERPWITLAIEDGMLFYCLAVVKSDHDDINIIGENFMTGYRIVFDNEKPAVGWKASDCGDAVPFIPNSPIPGSSTRTSVASSSLIHSYLATAILVVQILSIQLTVL